MIKNIKKVFKIKWIFYEYHNIVRFYQENLHIIYRLSNTNMCWRMFQPVLSTNNGFMILGPNEIWKESSTRPPILKDYSDAMVETGIANKSLAILTII